MPRAASRAARAIKFIERYCRVPEGAHVGKPLKLDPFQKRFIKDVLDNKVPTTLAILSMARKNGKTALIAAILLVFLVGPEAKRNSQIVSGAMSKDQAALVFALACKMVQLSPELSKVVKVVPSGKRLYGLPLNVEYRALAADATTGQGLSPRLAILDEVGQVRGPKSEFVEAIVTAQGAYDDALLVAISTQAPNDGDLLSIWIDDAQAGHDPGRVCHLYAAPADCALDDKRAWKAANPALGKFRSEADLAKLASAAARMPSAESGFRNLNLNQRVEQHAPFVTRSVWERNGGVVIDTLFAERPVYVGIDLSARADLTAIVFVTQDAEDVWHAQCHFFTPESTLTERSRRDRAPYDVWARQGLITATPGASVDYDWVAQWFLQATGRMSDLQVLAFDRWRIDVFRGALLRAGAPEDLLERLQPFGQGTQSMSPAVDALEDALLNARLRHGCNPVLTMCAANTRVWKDTSGNRKFEKQKTSGRIDGMVALAMAMGVAVAAQSEDDEPFVVAL